MVTARPPKNSAGWLSASTDQVILLKSEDKRNDDESVEVVLLKSDDKCDDDNAFDDDDDTSDNSDGDASNDDLSVSSSDYDPEEETEDHGLA